jgi:8-oxo-dGTP pyrophosphatase MutT (NUDIX family)
MEQPKLKIAGIYVVWDGHVLIHKRSDKAGSEASWHKFASPGGKVDPEDNGSFRTAALRELEEETGLSGAGKRLHVLRKESNKYADSVMYWIEYTKKPEIPGPDKASQKSMDIEFDFEKAGVKGEVAGPAYFWAKIPDVLTYLKAHPKYSNPYFVKNVRLLRRSTQSKKTTTRKQTRRSDEEV